MHTPGPWRVIYVDGFAPHIMGADQCRVTTIDDCHPGLESIDNINLIAAAPELLNACQTAFDLLIDLIDTKKATPKDMEAFCLIAKTLIKARNGAV
jgi:hypothetical protein